MKKEALLPAEIMEWSACKNFESLTPAEQQLVLGYMSVAGYEELYHAHMETSSFFEPDKTLKPSLQTKENLDRAFRQKHQRPKSVWLQPVALWKAAAVFLVLFSASCLYLKKNSGAQNTNGLLVHDTIFVEKKIEAIKHIIDTVVEYRYAETVRQKAGNRPKLLVDAGEERHDTAMVPRTRNEHIGIRTLQPEDLMKELPNSKGRSVYDDELVKRFSFARI